MFRRPFAVRLLFVLPLALCAASAPALERAGAPGEGDHALPLWKVQRFDQPDGEVWVLAELGFGRAPVGGLDPMVERVFREADTLVVPVDDTRPGFAAASARAVEAHRRLARGTLSELLPEPAWASLRTVMVRAGTEPATLADARPWYAQGWLEWSFYEGRGFDAAHSLHRALIVRARGRKTLVELEDDPARLTATRALDDRTAAALLEYSLEQRARLSKMPVLFERAVASGDLREVEAEIEHHREREPAFAAAWHQMVYRQALRYTDALFERARQPGTQLVVLPVGLTIGEQGVPRLLAGRGLDVTRVHRTRRDEPRIRVAAPTAHPQPRSEPAADPLRAPASQPPAAARVEPPRRLHVQRGRRWPFDAAAQRDGAPPLSDLHFRRFQPLGPDGLRANDMRALGCPPCVVLSIPATGEASASGQGIAPTDPVFTLRPRDVREALLVDSTSAATLDATDFGLVLVLTDDARPRVRAHAYDRRPDSSPEFLAASLPGASEAWTALVHSSGIMLALPSRQAALDVAGRLGLASEETRSKR